MKLTNQNNSTLGPRGEVGVNKNLRTPSLAVLPMLVEHVDNGGRSAKYVEREAKIVLK
jgi:hypothetical protein